MKDEDISCIDVFWYPGRWEAVDTNAGRGFLPPFGAAMASRTLESRLHFADSNRLNLSQSFTRF